MPVSSASRSRSPASRLRSLLETPGVDQLMEAHNGISARIVEEAGFPGIWASSLTLSAQFGVRDNNEASWTQILEMVEFMSDATAIPILVDGDTGYGNFNNTRRLVRKLEQRNVAGVCIEDKQFPKKNSFIDSKQQPLADVEEFCGKIRAAKDTQSDPDFCVIARVEALIAGWGVQEALNRAEAYREAGADAILIHSKQSDPEPVLRFAREWDRRHPLVIVPTTYYQTPLDVFEQLGIHLVIWANHILRASVKYMQEIAAQIRQDRSVADVEDRVAGVSEIFRLQRAGELKRAESKYARTGSRSTTAILLGATRGKELGRLTEDRPKLMVPIAGRPLLRRIADELKQQEIHNQVVVGGYRSSSLPADGIQVEVNPNHDSTGELASLDCALDHLSDDSLIMYGDLLFRSYVLRDLLESPHPVVIVVDSSLPGDQDQLIDAAFCSRPDDRSLLQRDVYLEEIAPDWDGEESIPDGRWIGMVRVQDEGVDWFRSTLEDLRAQSGFRNDDLPSLLNALVEKGYPVSVQYIHGHWMDVNQLEDLERAREFAHDRWLPGHRRKATS